MAWIELHDNLPDHPKVLDLAAILKMDKDMVVGKLVRLWTWALANREDGVFAERDIGTVAEVMRFKGKPERLISALVATRLLDREGESYRIHDWDERVGMLLAKRETIREQTKERVKRFRSKNRNAENAESNALQDGCVTQDVTQGNAGTVPKPYLNQNHTVVITPLNPPEGKGADDIAEIVGYLNEKTGSNFKASTAATRKQIGARLKEGYTVGDCKRVIDDRVRRWKGTEQEQYLRPSTLFAPSKFEGYLNAAPKDKPPDDWRKDFNFYDGG